MDKQAILNEIRRTASENGGTPLGRGKFLQETGIKEADWSGKFWIRRGDAVREAGFEPNQLQSAYGDEFLIKKFIELGREIGHFSVTTERQMKARIDDSFPSSKNQISLQLPEDLELITPYEQTTLTE